MRRLLAASFAARGELRKEIMSGAYEPDTERNAPSGVI
jgi:hypothetical protein